MNYRELLKLQFRNARWHGGSIEPKCIIIHHTATTKNGKPCDADKFLAYNNALSKASVHFHVGLNGTVTVYTNLIGLSDKFCFKANHAGKSRWTYNGETYVGLNNHSIGIEVAGDTNKWALTDEQREALIVLCKWIKQQFPILNDKNRWLRHADVAIPVGRKSDIGLRLFSWINFIKDVFDPNYKV